MNSGRFKVYAPDGSEECSEFWRQCERAEYAVRANQQLNFYVPEREGHDDFVISAALLAHAATRCGVEPAGGMVSRPVEYEDGRY